MHQCGTYQKAFFRVLRCAKSRRTSAASAALAQHSLEYGSVCCNIAAFAVVIALYGHVDTHNNDDNIGRDQDKHRSYRLHPRKTSDTCVTFYRVQD